MKVTRALWLAAPVVVLVLGGCVRGDTRANIVGYHTGSGNTVVVTIELGPGDAVKEARATEQTVTRVTVEALIDRADGDQPSIAVRKDVEIQLDQPLGNRTVVAADSDTPIPFVTPS